mmetsp:Transcript_6239/g.8435  ORF Transcript_6239/g.8435 Transcript_6239/m.8435 type:complete len:155 (+) Transcript_6239:140-604(+)
MRRHIVTTYSHTKPYKQHNYSETGLFLDLPTNVRLLTKCPSLFIPRKGSAAQAIDWLIEHLGFTSDKIEPLHRASYNFSATKRNDGVNNSFCPASTRSRAVAFKRALTFTDPRGAIRAISSKVTIVWVHILPIRVMRKPESVKEPHKVSYHGIS